MRDDLLILALAAAAAYIIVKAVPATTVRRRAGKLEIPEIFTPGGGWRPDGTYDRNLLDDQYREGWGYGD